MSKVKDLLLARQKDLKEQLKELEPIVAELKEVEKALQALEPPSKCVGYPCIYGNGCDECRLGWAYR